MAPTQSKGRLCGKRGCPLRWPALPKQKGSGWFLSIKSHSASAGVAVLWRSPRVKHTHNLLLQESICQVLFLYLICFMFHTTPSFSFIAFSLSCLTSLRLQAFWGREHVFTERRGSDFMALHTQLIIICSAYKMKLLRAAPAISCLEEGISALNGKHYWKSQH